MNGLLARPAVKYGLVAVLIALVYFSISSLGWGSPAIPRVTKTVQWPHAFQPSENGTPALLPVEEAKEYCARRRWEPYPKRDRQRKVYDLFMVNTELDWMEIRMGELASEVDYFIVLESATDFQDRPKPLHVKNHWSRFSPFHHKIVHHVLNVTGQTLGDAWARERFSRNAMMDQVFPTLTGEQEVQQGDVIVVSDVDEIPRPEVIKSLRNCAFPRRLRLRTVYYRYSFQWTLREEQWIHPQATFFDGPDTVRPEDLRMGTTDADVFHAGWHCSSCLANLKDMVNKVTSFSHSEFNQPDFRDPAKILQRVRQGLDPYNRTAKIYDRIDRNPDVPKYLLEHQDEFAYLVNRDLPSANFKDIHDFKFS
jgi:beta-1,4-mannosyl-glycoprotein beta-1,4-N-acetylglucosaminyltransferase